MKRDWKYIVPLILTFIGMVLYQIYGPKPLDWKHSFSKEDKIPFGNYLLFSNLKDLFPKKEIIPVEKTIYETLENQIENSNYIFVNDKFNVGKHDVEKLLNFVSQGNYAFVASQDFGRLSDTLNFKLKDNLFFSGNQDSGSVMLQKDSVMMTFVEGGSRDNYYYKTESMFAYFDSLDLNTSHSQAVNEYGQTVLAEITFGRGKFYLSSTPLAFTNYNFLHNNNAEFIEKSLSLLPVRDVLWDEYYQRERINADTPLRFILGQEPLKWAYFTTLLSLILFMVFEAKRRQRAIPIIVPPKNDSLDFVKTIGRLYFFYRNNKSIANRKILYFFEFVRSKFHIKTNVIDAEFIDILSHKSGVEKDKVKQLIGYINHIHKSREVGKENLIHLNKLIKEFNNNIK